MFFNGEEEMAVSRAWYHTSRMMYFTYENVLQDYPLNDRRALFFEASSRYTQEPTATQLRFHGAFEPSVGMSDAMIVVTFESPPETQMNHLVKMMNDTALVRVAEVEPSVATPQNATLFDAAGGLVVDQQLCEQPGNLSSKNPRSRHSESDLRFPIAQHADSEKERAAAMNWLKLHSVAAVSFMFALGISGQPVYGILTCGTVASVMCTWYSVESDYHIYMFDNHRISRYDISCPLDCLNFAAFILRLRREAEKLRDVIAQGGYVEKFFRQSEDSPLRNWTVEALSKRFEKEYGPSYV
ncbi:hypothetical protein H0H81_000360 [Sphagnurus paluster]|uniref:Uncharacterized protein n=1 Tax=Sphagnurus paluster TaxID=117069 RepID=A0A9P7FPH4_9AGAR|nr:hypothetical protein H0H81_000360 [Sphagnurus paluster]